MSNTRFADRWVEPTPTSAARPHRPGPRPQSLPVGTGGSSCCPQPLGVTGMLVYTSAIAAVPGDPALPYLRALCLLTAGVTGLSAGLMLRTVWRGVSGRTRSHAGAAEFVAGYLAPGRRPHSVTGRSGTDAPGRAGARWTGRGRGGRPVGPESGRPGRAGHRRAAAGVGGAAGRGTGGGAGRSKCIGRYPRAIVGTGSAAVQRTDGPPYTGRACRSPAPPPARRAWRRSRYHAGASRPQATIDKDLAKSANGRNGPLSCAPSAYRLDALALPLGEREFSTHQFRLEGQLQVFTSLAEFVLGEPARRDIHPATGQFRRILLPRKG